MKPITAAELGKLLGISKGSVGNLASDRVLPRADRGLYDPAACVQAFIAHRVKTATAGDGNVASLTQERSRLARLKADAAEREALIEAGDLVPAADVAAGWLKIVATVRSRILAVPTKLAARIVAAKTPAEAQEMLKRELHAALAELAEGKQVSTTAEA